MVRSKVVPIIRINTIVTVLDSDQLYYIFSFR